MNVTINWQSFGVGLGVGIAGISLYNYFTTGKTVSRMTSKGERAAPIRYAGACRMKPDMYAQYTRLHDHTWDEVMERMYKANMRNFVVYLHEETWTMFHHWEYIGDDFAADMATLDNDELIKFWWSHCEPCQEPFTWSGPPPSQGGTGGPGGSWWAPLKCLTHTGAWPVAWSKSWPDPDFKPNNPDGKLSSYTNRDGLVHNRK